MKFFEQVFEDGNVIKTLYPTDQQDLIKQHHTIVIDDKQTSYEQKLLYKSDDDKFLFIESEHPPIIINVNDYGIRYAFSGFKPYYLIEKNDDGDIYTAFVTLNSCPAGIPERFTFKFASVTYDSSGTIAAPIGIYIHCEREPAQQICSRLGIQLPKRNLIIGKNDVFSLHYNLGDWYNAKAFRYHDVRGKY